MAGEYEVGFSFLAENSSDIICRAGLDLALHYASPSTLPLLGWQAEEVIGKSLNAFVSAEDATLFASAVGVPHAPALERAPVILRMQKKDGTLRSMEIRRRLLLDAATGEPREYVLLMRDVSNGGLEADRPSPALPFRLTGLPTHPEFLRQLEREWKRAQREGNTLSLLRLDFNGFRQFHFLDGHRVGDECLAKAAAAVQGVLRLTDFPAHYRAEDIVILLPATTPEGAAKVAHKIRSVIHALRSPRSLEGQAWAAVSIGIATVTPKAESLPRMPELLLLCAEHALQKAQQEEAESLRHIAAYSAHNADWKKSMPGLAPRCA